MSSLFVLNNISFEAGGELRILHATQLGAPYVAFQK